MRRRTAHTVNTLALQPLTTVASGRRLSEGALVQASVRARLLGLPLLRLDATVVLVPAAIGVSQPPLAAGNGVTDALRSINEGAEILAQVRRNGRR